jgi:hypothetical protein
MPTYINESNYMQMNRLPKNRNFGGQRLGIDPSHNFALDFQDLDCKQIFHHFQNCPVCQHVFTLKQPSGTVQSSFSTSNKIELPISTLVIFAVLIILFFVFTIKTLRN